MSSNTVVKSVGKKLKYYFEVKRLEEGFDLSDVNSPILDHPPLKARSALQYNGLHDRPLKHYFSQPEVRVQLTQLGLKNSHLKNPRERNIKQSLTKVMKRHQFLKSSIPDCYYVQTPAGMKVHPQMVGFGANPKSQKKKALKGGWPVMRSVPPVNISRGEAERLVNSAARLLAATTDWDLVHKLDPAFSVTGSESSQAKQPKGKRRPLTAKYTWDLDGHRVPSAKIKAYDDSYLDKVPRRPFLRQRRSPSPTSTSETEESTQPPPRPPPPPANPPTPPPPSKHRQRTVINMPSEQIRDEVKVTRRSPRKYETGSQTDRHLLEEYDHDEEKVTEGPWGEYQIYVKTGDRIGASTSADVNITIYGEKGSTPPISLGATPSKHNKVKFQRGKEDLFIVAAHHVGKMKKVKIGHDRPQLAYAWFLEHVTILDMNDKVIYDFPCNHWLSGQDEDQRTYRVLPVDRQRAFVDALEKPDTRRPRSRRSQSDSEDSESSEESSSKGKDKASMRAKRSQRSHSSSSDSASTSASETETDSEEGAVVRMSAASTPREKKKEETGGKIEDSVDKAPGTVIQFQKKGSQKVEEEVVLSSQGKAPRVEQEYMAGYKAGVDAAEASERKRREEERTRDRQLLSGSSIHDACRAGDLNRVKELLDKFPEMKDFKDESGYTPLHVAAEKGRVDIIKWLTSSGRDDIDAETPTGYTPIHLAAMNGHFNAMTVLNAMGADIGCTTADGQSPLHLASEAGHLDCVKWLVGNRADLTAEDSAGRSPSDLAQQYKQTSVVTFLKECERDLADPNSAFAQMHRVQQRGGSVALPTIREDDKTSTGSDQAQAGSGSTGHRRRGRDREDRLLQEKREVYAQQQHHMESQGVSFLDSIRQDLDSEA